MESGTLTCTKAPDETVVFFYFGKENAQHAAVLHTLTPLTDFPAQVKPLHTLPHTAGANAQRLPKIPSFCILLNTILRFVQRSESEWSKVMRGPSRKITALSTLPTEKHS